MTVALLWAAEVCILKQRPAVAYFVDGAGRFLAQRDRKPVTDVCAAAF